MLNILGILYISGYCTEYNEGGGIIQRQLSSPCGESILCDESYQSTQSFICKKYAIFQFQSLSN